MNKQVRTLVSAIITILTLVVIFVKSDDTAEEQQRDGRRNLQAAAIGMVKPVLIPKISSPIAMGAGVSRPILVPKISPTNRWRKGGNNSKLPSSDISIVLVEGLFWPVPPNCCPKLELLLVSPIISCILVYWWLVFLNIDILPDPFHVISP